MHVSLKALSVKAYICKCLKSSVDFWLLLISRFFVIGETGENYNSYYSNPCSLSFQEYWIPSLTGLNLSANSWGRCLNWVYRHILWCVHPPTAQYTWLYKKLPVSQCQVYWTPSLCFLFWQFFHFMLRVFVLYSQYSYSILNEKLIRQQTFESMSLLGALIQTTHFIIVIITNK